MLKIGGLETVISSDQEARTGNCKKGILERRAGPTFPFLIEMRERHYWVAHELFPVLKYYSRGISFELCSDTINSCCIHLNCGSSILCILHIDSLQVSAIHFDPSCSGSGTVLERLDHLLPSHSASNFIPVMAVEIVTPLPV